MMPFEASPGKSGFETVTPGASLLNAEEDTRQSRLDTKIEVVLTIERDVLREGDVVEDGAQCENSELLRADSPGEGGIQEDVRSE
jgi:hypothetical protein